MGSHSVIGQHPRPVRRLLLLRLRLLHLRRLLPILLLPILCSLLRETELHCRNSHLLVSHSSNTDPLSSRYFSDALIADSRGFRLFSFRDAPHTGFLLEEDRVLRAG